MSYPEGHKHVKASELFRERAVARYFGAVRDLAIPAPDVDILSRADTVPRPFIPQSSKETALTAFAQLATLRLDASRSFISLIDSTTQYILSEASKTLSIQSESRHGSGDSLLLGSVRIPRTSGTCGLALENAISLPLTEGANEDDIYVIEDLWTHPVCTGAHFLTSGPRSRFYAGAPLRAFNGAIVGIYCVFDEKLRPGGLQKEEKEFLRDMAKTTMDHLETMRLRTQHSRSNRLVGGLESFIDGLASVRSPEQEAENRRDPLAEDPINLAQRDVAAEPPRFQSSDRRDFAPEGEEADAPGIAPRSLWELALPPGSKPMFSRAATIIQQSGDYDGVAFFYMDSHHDQKGHSSHQQSKRRNSSTANKAETLPAPAVDPPLSFHNETTSDGRAIGWTDDEDASAAEQPSPKSACPLLSYSLASEDSVKSQAGPFQRFRQRDLDRLIGSKGPRARARTITLNRRGDVLPGDTSSSGSGPEQTASLSLHERVEDITLSSNASEARRSKLQRQLIKSLRKLSSDALAYGCLPLWDFERQRYLAYCIVWSTSGSRHMKEDGDLTYLRIFSNSIAIALSHIDAIADNHAKSTFVSSMSHELRSPLHGVLSASNFLKDSPLSRFQQEMVDVISKCGHTLLDTVDHVMDYAKMSSLAPERKASASPLSTPVLQAQGEPSGPSLSSIVDLSVLLEEVIETVLMGFSVQHDFVHHDEDPRATYKRAPSFKSSATTLASSGRSLNSRGRVRIVIQLPQRNWCVRTQAGAWRRIIMNLFGNALKYTKDGLINIRMEVSTDDTSLKLPISLYVDDTGKGISKRYLDTHLFKPFSQEDEFSSGTGLGLSIVKQITDALGGTINVSSSEGVGTNVRVQLVMPKASATSTSLEDTSTIAAVAQRLHGKRICVLDDTRVIPSVDATARDTEFYTVLAKTLKEWFGVEAPMSATWPAEQVDLIVCLKPMLKSFGLATTDEITRQPIVIITHDALEMAVLRADERIARTDAVIVMVSQPIGPHKLARTLGACLERQDRLNADSHDDSATKSSSQLQIPIRGSSPTPSTSPSELSRHVSEEEEHREPFVLIVDDNQVNLRLLSLFVKKQSLRYEQACNGQEALDIYLAAKDSVRCILMDISMPIMDGMTATRHIREVEQQEQLPRTPVIALTGLTSAAARNEAYEAGMDKFLIKPVGFDQLRDILSGIEGISYGEPIVSP